MNPNLRRLVATLAMAFAGCGGEGGSSPGSANSAAESSRVALAEVGEMYRLFADEKGKPPKSWKDLERYFTAFTEGSMAIQEGRVAVLWGADVQPGSSDILAYDVAAPEAGGPVLQRDGETINSLTAEEFQAAPKAPGKLSEPGKAKGAAKKAD